MINQIKYSEFHTQYLITYYSGTFDVRSINITHPVTRGQVCLTVEYVEGHDPNPSCFVMFRSIATGHDLSVAINGTSMCVHLSPQVYTIVATDTEDEINTTAPAVIISNVTVPSYPQMSSSMLLQLLASTSMVLPTGTYSETLIAGTAD